MQQPEPLKPFEHPEQYRPPPGPDDENPRQPPAPKRDIGALRPPLMLTTLIVLGMLTAAVIAWSPWNGGEKSKLEPVQGGGEQPSIQLVAPTPTLIPQDGHY